MARSLNRAQLIGNLTRDPELRYTANGTAVCSFGLATNRTWKTDAGEKREEADFHNIVAWNKLAEICSQFLVKGRKAYVEGRLSTRKWTGQDGNQRSTTEIVISDMILLDSKRPDQEQAPAEEQVNVKEQEPVDVAPVSGPKDNKPSDKKSENKSADKKDKKEAKVAPEAIKEEDVSSNDIPF